MQTNALVQLDSTGGSDVMLGFLCLFTHYHGTNHYCMPRWPDLVEASTEHLSRPGDSCWRGRYAAVTNELRSRFEDPWARLGKSLCNRPEQLNLDLFDSLVGSGVLMLGEASILGYCKG